MTRHFLYKLTPECESKAHKLNLTTILVSAMARRAAPVSHDLGNWRFGEFVLEIDGDTVVEIDRMDWRRDDIRHTPISMKERADLYHMLSIPVSVPV